MTELQLETDVAVTPCSVRLTLQLQYETTAERMCLAATLLLQKCLKGL